MGTSFPAKDITLPPPSESTEKALDRVRGAGLKTTDNVHRSKSLPTVQKKRLELSMGLIQRVTDAQSAKGFLDSLKGTATFHFPSGEVTRPEMQIPASSQPS